MESPESQNTLQHHRTNKISEAPGPERGLEADKIKTDVLLHPSAAAANCGLLCDEKDE